MFIRKLSKIRYLRTVSFVWTSVFPLFITWGSFPEGHLFYFLESYSLTPVSTKSAAHTLPLGSQGVEQRYSVDKWKGSYPLL